MTRGKTIDDILANAEKLLRVWAANPDFALAGVTLVSLQAMVDDLRAKRTQVETTRTQLTKEVNEANDSADAVNAIVTRARTAGRGYFGPDSSQYEQLGGTRDSEKKPRKTGKKSS
ncbi:MAG: hypothetical protein QOC96_615 [Acidobacteriota bacterium]|jgi:hypothetical protein|nr:hypothetical protein [Acidobacteriota bacterium]